MNLPTWKLSLHADVCRWDSCRALHLHLVLMIQNFSLTPIYYNRKLSVICGGRRKEAVGLDLLTGRKTSSGLLLLRFISAPNVESWDDRFPLLLHVPEQRCRNEGHQQRHRLPDIRDWSRPYWVTCIPAWPLQKLMRIGLAYHICHLEFWFLPEVPYWLWKGPLYIYPRPSRLASNLPEITLRPMCP